MVASEGLLLSARGLGRAYEVSRGPWHLLGRALGILRRNQQPVFQALSGVGLELRRGETLGIIGRNGAGKSTLLQILCGTLAGTEGVCTRYGRVAALLELGAGFNPEFTGRENVFLNAAILGLSQAEIMARFEAIVSFADIGDFIDEPVKHYSSGMFLRLAFSVVAHVDADVLVVDEALAVGDAVFTQKCMRFLRQFRQRGALLFVSHDMGAVTGLCDRVLWLEHGQPRMLGTAKETVQAYLEHIYAQQQETEGVTRTAGNLIKVQCEDYVDARRSLIVHSNLRNDIRVPIFTPESGKDFGSGGARIVSVRLLDELARPLAWVVGGEKVTLEIQFEAGSPIKAAIVGFLLQDRLGQFLFGDNTYLSYMDAPVGLQIGEVGMAKFSFRLPYLPKGKYAIAIGIAEGSQVEHIQHHWMHEALIIEAVGETFVPGLIGVCMEQIELSARPSTAAHLSGVTKC